MADAGARLVARIIDAALLLIPQLLLAAIGIGVGLGLGFAFAEPETGGFTLAIVFGFVLALGLTGTLSYVYLVNYLCRHEGQTIGKRSQRIRVVRLDGTAVTVAEAKRRWLSYEGVSLIGFLLSIFTTVYVYLDVLWLLCTKPNRQCLHDKYAKTVVVKVLG